ncbi:hypothetical protein PO909_027102 [Leuciscus waleckii]
MMIKQAKIEQGYHQGLSALSLSEIVQSVRMKTRERNCEEDLYELRPNMKKNIGQNEDVVGSSAIFFFFFLCV